jgi:Ser/Thr protein kinase RdoA (MazF antagonist)
MENLIPIASQFASEKPVTGIKAFGSGNINDTFLVTIDCQEESCFVMQRLNTQVFNQPELVMRNMRILTDRVLERLPTFPLSAKRRWEIPRVLLTMDNLDRVTDEGGNFWRAISFLDNSYSIDAIENTHYGREVGYALGTFHHLISDLPPAELADTLPGFHITPSYLKKYIEVLTKRGATKSPEVDYCIEFIQNRQELAHVLENAKAQGKLKLRTMHGDPKVNNVMLDRDTDCAIGMIDLDTVKPGLIHYDIGDCLRSGCNPVGEETKDWESIHFETDLCQAILQGYLSQAKDFLTENDYAYIFDSMRLLAFELGLRFFTDYLAGNVYFKVTHPEHNLDRALVQFKLTESIEAQESIIRKIIRDR